MKTDAKIDMLHRAGAFNVSRPVKQEESGGETSEMEDVETSLVSLPMHVSLTKNAV